MQKTETVSFSLRLPKKLHARLIGICGGTSSEVTRSGLIVEAIELFVALVDARPSMIPGYDPEQDKSARQEKRRQRKRENCNTEDKCAKK